MLPGTAAGTPRRKAVTVANPISACEAFLDEDWPGVTMFGFNRVPSKKT